MSYAPSKFAIEIVEAPVEPPRHDLFRLASQHTVERLAVHASRAGVIAILHTRAGGDQVRKAIHALDGAAQGFRQERE